MKKQHTLALLLLAGLALGACSSDDDAAQSEPQSPNEVKTYHATTVVSLGGEGTRALSLDGNTLNAVWGANDKVYVVGCEGFMSPTTSGGATTNLAGNITGTLSEGQNVTLRFPCEEVSYTGQKGTFEDLQKNFDYAELETKVETVNGSNITIEGGVLENKQAIVRFTFSQAISALTISSEALAYPVTVAPASASTELYVAMPIKAGVSGAATYTFTEFNNDHTQYRSVDKSYTLENGKFYGATLSLSNWENAYVEIGGIKWAKMNIGAASETGYGSYFAWGETEEKSDYSWNTYKFNPSGDGSTFTKYTSSDETLEADDDAATANWGSNWRMPTSAEWEALLDNTTREWTTINSVEGMKFTSTLDANKYIFLPAASYRYNSGLSDEGSCGYYWSSSLYEDNPSRACYLYFYSGHAGTSNGRRYYGQSLRAVYVGVGE